MRKFIIKYLIASIFMFIVSMLIWGVIVYFWFQHTIENSLEPVISKVQTELSETETDISKYQKDQLKLFFTDLEQSKEIVTFSFLSHDKSLNYTEGIRKRDNILWKLNVAYPVEIGKAITGWIKVWPSPELVLNAFLSEKNIFILLLSFVLLVSLFFCASAIYIIKKFMLPLFEFRKAIKNMANGKDGELHFKYNKGIWKEIGESLKKLNIRVIDINSMVQMLLTVSKTLTSQVEMNKVFNIIMSIIQKKFPDAKCAIILPGEDGNLKVIAKRGYSKDFPKNIKIADGGDGNPIAETYIMGKMTIIKNMQASEKAYFNDFISEGITMQINIPLTDDAGMSLGVLNVGAMSEEIFDADIIEAISTLGKYLSIALRNAKMYDRVQEHNTRLKTEVDITSNELLQTNARLIRKVRDIKTLSDISVFASAKFDIIEISSFIMQKIKDLTGMESIAILLKKQNTEDFFFLPGSFGIESDSITQYIFNETRSEIIKDIKNKRTSIVLNDPDKIKKDIPEFASITPIHSAVFVPVENEGNICAFIIAINKFGAPIADNDVNIIEHISVLLSGMISKVKLYSELEKKVNNLTFLQEISSTISNMTDLSKTLEKIIDVIKEAFKADMCAILLYDAKTHYLITQPGAFFTGGTDKILLKIHKDDENSLSAKTFRDGVSYISADAIEDPAIKSHSAKEWGIRSMIVVPLINDNEVIGVLRVGDHKANVYTEEDKDLIIMIANQAAMIIKNANLYEKLANIKESISD